MAPLLLQLFSSGPMHRPMCPLHETRQNLPIHVLRVRRINGSTVIALGSIFPLTLRKILLLNILGRSYVMLSECFGGPRRARPYGPHVAYGEGGRHYARPRECRRTAGE